MTVTTDIAEMYRRPRTVIRRQMEMGQREDRVLLYLMLACGLIFVAQWPRLSRDAFTNPDVPLQALLGGALMAWMFMAPLILYALAGLTRLVARVIGGRGTWFSARLALFWSLLAAVPLWLLTGMVAGFIGPGPGLNLTGGLALGVFLLFWAVSLIETEKAGLPA